MVNNLRGMMKSDQKGFTLIELIIVMAILAVLAAIAIPKYGTVMTDSKYKAHNSNVQLITQAAELYYNQDSTAATTAYGTSIAIGDATVVGGLVAKGYLKEVPVNPVEKSVAYKVQISDTGAVTVNPGKMAQDDTGKWPTME